MVIYRGEEDCNVELVRGGCHTVVGVVVLTSSSEVKLIDFHLLDLSNIASPIGFEMEPHTIKFNTSNK